MSAAAATRRPAPVDPDDGTLVARALEGDERAFAALYHRHARYIAGVIFRLTGDASDIDDLVQETFVSASLSLSRLKDAQSLRAWLVTIAVRRSQKRLSWRIRQRWLGREMERQAPLSSDPRARRAADELYDVLDRLSPRLRVPWILVRVEGENLQDVAQICGVSLATVKRRIARAEEFVQRRLRND